MNETRTLADFASKLRFDDLPRAVVERTEELFADWLASALAGGGSRQVSILSAFAKSSAGGGAAEMLCDGSATSAYWAAFVNAAASHVVEQDDIHNASVLHPGTVVFPVALALAQEKGASGPELIASAVAGYEIGTRVGMYLGRKHYKIFHTTGTAGTLAAAACAARLLRLNPELTRNALGNAGTQAAGLWEFLRDAADSKQLHTAHASATGVLSARLAELGFTGARTIIEGPQGMGAGLGASVDSGVLTKELGTRWQLAETSFKLHASCRHTHPAADALLALMVRQGIRGSEIRRVVARVHQAAIDVLGAVGTPRSIHQAKFSMGFVLAVIALRGSAGIDDFTAETLEDESLLGFMRRVEMQFDSEIDAAYPDHWRAIIEVEMLDGRRFLEHVNCAKGDPDNPLSRDELTRKFRRLGRLDGHLDLHTLDRLLEWSLSLRAHAHVGSLLAAGNGS